MAYPLIYPAIEWLLGMGAAGAGLAALNKEEVPVPRESLRRIGNGLHWLIDPKWGGFATAMTYSPTTIERMPDGSYFGYQSWNNPDGTFGSEIRPNTLGTVAVMSRPRYSVISSRLYDEAPSDSIPAGTTNAPANQTDAGTASPAPASPEPERNDSTNNKKGFLRRTLGLESRPFSGKGHSVGKYTRDALRLGGFWIPATTAVGAAGIDLAGNIIGAALEPDTISHEMTFPLTRLRFTPEIGILKLLGSKYKTTPVKLDTVKTTKATQTTTDSIPINDVDTVQAVTTESLPNNEIETAGANFEAWKNSRQ